MSSAAPIRRGRGRRPSGQVRAEILAAAGALVLEQGMAGFTIEGVAARAGASKMTIYKWWPSKGVLALEGYAATIATELAVPDSGDIATDLSEQLVFYVGLLRDTRAGSVTAELIGASQTDPDLAAALRQSLSGPNRARGHDALARAQKRGQIRPDVDPDVLIDQLWGACLYRLMMPDQPLTEAFARELVSNLLAGVATTPALVPRHTST